MSVGAETALIAAAKAGDEAAFRDLTKRYRRELHVHCYRMLGSIHDAEDALQDSLLSAWRHLAGFEGRSSYRAWLYRIATNACLRVAARRTPPAHDQEIALTPYPDRWLDELPSDAAEPERATTFGKASSSRSSPPSRRSRRGSAPCCCSATCSAFRRSRSQASSR